MDNKCYRSLNDYFRERFSQKVYKLALSISNTCPNRDGSVGFGGCIFCSGQGSGDFAENCDLPIVEQIDRSKQRVAQKNKNGAYCAYFQSFTSTYCKYEKLEKSLYDAVNHPDIVTLSVATRPDCLSERIINLLSKINKIKPVMVELGLQSSSEKTVSYIRRGYVNEVYSDAVKRLKAMDIEVVTHIIIGLPGETGKDVIRTLDFAVKSGTDGVKLQLLHVLKNTDLYLDYEQGKFKVLSIEEYTKILADCIEYLPENIVIHRLTGDGAKRELVAPLWSADKKYVLNYINRYFKENNIKQGKRFME